MQAVADLEDLQDREDVEADHRANCPLLVDLPPRTKRNVATLKNKVSTAISEDSKLHLGFPNSLIWFFKNNTTAQLPIESEDSSDKYAPNASDSNEDLDKLDGEEPKDQSEGHVPAKKRPCCKKMCRSDVIAACSFMSTTQEHASGKRKEMFSASQDDQQT